MNVNEASKIAVESGTEESKSFKQKLSSRWRTATWTVSILCLVWWCFIFLPAMLQSETSLPSGVELRYAPVADAWTQVVFEPPRRICWNGEYPNGTLFKTEYWNGSDWIVYKGGWDPNMSAVRWQSNGDQPVPVYFKLYPSKQKTCPEDLRAS